MLTGVAARVTAGMMAREPKSLAIIAWYDGWAQAVYGAQPKTYPRELTPREAESWREGWAEGREQRLEQDARDAAYRQYLSERDQGKPRSQA